VWPQPGQPSQPARGSGVVVGGGGVKGARRADSPKGGVSGAPVVERGGPPAYPSIVPGAQPACNPGNPV
jgi:hypothetical protein